MEYKIIMTIMFFTATILQLTGGNLNLVITCNIAAGLFAIAAAISDK